MSGTIMESLMNNGGTGAMTSGEAAELMKALTATPGGSDVATLSGGAALRVQSLDRTMQATIQDNSDFALFNRLPKPKAGGTLDEWTEQNGIGGFPGGNTNTETGTLTQSTGSYNRRTGQVKFLTTMRQVSLVLTAQDAIASAESLEYSNGALELLTSAEVLSYEGDSTVVPTEFDGIYAQLNAAVNSGVISGDHIIDANGASLSSINSLNQASATIRANQNFGKATDLFMSLQVQADFDNGLDPAFRVALNGAANGGTMIGAPVIGIRTSGGNIKTNDAIFIRDQPDMVPFQLRFPQVAAGQTMAGLVPSAINFVVVNNAASKFGAGQAGTYYYAVAGVNAQGQSNVLVSAQVTVGAGQSVQITIGGSASLKETGYAIHRSRLNGGNAVSNTTGVPADGVSDFREMLRIPANPNGGATYVDLNRDLPGACKAFVLNLTPGATAINWRQLMPMGRFNLYPTNSLVMPWAQFLFGYLRISKLRHHVAIKNIIPQSAMFKPFNV